MVIFLHGETVCCEHGHGDSLEWRKAMRKSAGETDGRGRKGTLQVFRGLIGWTEHLKIVVGGN